MAKSLDQVLLRKLRLDKSYSQADLANMAGLTPRTIQRVEIEGMCSLRTLRALAKALDIEPTLLENSRLSLPAQLSSESAGLPLSLRIGAVLLILWGSVLALLTVLEIVLEPLLERYLGQNVETGFGLTLYIGVLCIVSGFGLFSLKSFWKNLALFCYGAVAIHTSIAVVRLISSIFGLGPVYASGFSPQQISTMQSGISILIVTLVPLAIFFFYQLYLLSKQATNSIFNR